MIDIDELDRLHAAATPGPWSREWNNHEDHEAGIDITQAIGLKGSCRLALIEMDEDAVADADSIVALHNAWTAISRELRALRAVAEHLAEAQRERDFQESTSQHDNYTDQARSRQREFEAINKACAAAKAAREETTDD